MKRHSKEDTNKKQDEILRNMNTRYKRTCATKQQHYKKQQGNQYEEQGGDSETRKEETREHIARRKKHDTKQEGEIGKKT